MILYINKYVVLIKVFRKYIYNNNKIVCIVCKVYKYIFNIKRKEIKKKMFNRDFEGEWILRYIIGLCMKFYLLYFSFFFWNLCMKYGIIEMVE